VLKSILAYDSVNSQWIWMVFSSKNSENSWQQSYQVRNTKNPWITHDEPYVWVMAVARGRPNHQKRAVTLVFGGVGGGSGQRKVQRPKTSVTTCFWGGAGKRKAQPLKTSSHACFREVWVVVGTMWEVG